jgi:hypothetical protein
MSDLKNEEIAQKFFLIPSKTDKWEVLGTLHGR